MAGFLIFLIIFCLIFFFVATIVEDKSLSCFFSFLAGATLILCIEVFISIKEKNNIPTALDVYQDKTTLEITYRDSIPVDSVVVFKDEFKK